MTKFETILGLEVHVQLNTRTKLFCGCPSLFGGEPNTRTCPVCTGQPGVLPVLNGEALRLALKSGLALGCEVAPLTRFDRKNYFYPDLPKGYQITQYALPIGRHGILKVEQEGDRIREFRISRIHLEEDAGKTLHPEVQLEGHPEVNSHGKHESLVDLNRAGIPLLEIVSEPWAGTPREAHAYLTALKRLLRYMDVSDCDMEKGSLRCDANLSLRICGERKLGVKVEIKNLNSFRNVKRALTYEAARQEALLRAGREVDQETRMWVEDEECTSLLRSKEKAQDYRYFPEPDLPPFEISEALISAMRRSLPESPLARRRRFQDHFGLSSKDAAHLTRDPSVADFFEQCVIAGGKATPTARFIRSSVMEAMNRKGKGITDLNISPDQMASLMGLIQSGGLSLQAAGQVFNLLLEEGGDPETVARRLGLEQVCDPVVLAQAVDEVLEECADLVREYREGKKAVLNALVGQVMRSTGGNANPGMVRSILSDKIRNGR